MAHYDTLALDLDGPIAHVRLNRGDALNTMTPAFWSEMITVFAAIEDNSSIRAVVLSAEGRLFTAGLDIATAQSATGPNTGDQARKSARMRRKILQMQESFSVIDRCRVPVIAVIQGACIGGGVDLVTACDIRIGTQDCYFTIQEVKIGIVADVGTLQRIPYLLPQGVVRELAYTGRKFGAEEAARYGFLNRVAVDHAAALDAGFSLAKQIAEESPVAVAGAKLILNKGRHQSIEDGLDYVATLNASQLFTDDVEKGISASMAKKAVNYDDFVD